MLIYKPSCLYVNIVSVCSLSDAVVHHRIKPHVSSGYYRIKCIMIYFLVRCMEKLKCILVALGFIV